MSDVFVKVIDSLVNELITDATALLKENYKLIKEVKQDVKTLLSALTRIESVLEDAANKQQDSATLKDWLEKLENIVYDTQDVLNTLATNTSRSQQKVRLGFIKRPFTAIRYKLNAASDIKSILRRLEEIEKEKEKLSLDVINGSTRISDDRITTPNVHELDVVGRGSDKDYIINKLLSEEFDKEGEISVLPIVGMGGVGKTTLAQLVYNDDQVIKNFKILMWVCVTDNYDHKKILKGMIESHSKTKYDADSVSDQVVESRVFEFLNKDNRFLLVLDDVWNDRPGYWKKLEAVLKHGGNGSKVLVTSRNTKVADIMGTEPSYPLGLMSEDDSWALFEKETFYRTSVGPGLRRDLEVIGKQIVDKCKGLPLAIRVIGGLLRNVSDVEKWRRILEHDIWEAEAKEYSMSPGRPEILPALRLSYVNLPYYLQKCFIHCCLFPKGHVFDKTELIKLWKSASLIPQWPRYELDDIGSEIFDELHSRSLFQFLNVDKKVTCRMHDMIHDLALSVSRPSYYQIRDDVDDLCPMPELVRHLAILRKDSPANIMDQLVKYEKLRTFIASPGYSWSLRALEKLIQTWKYVQTLDLSSNVLTKLPESVGDMKLLTFLNLSNTEIRKLPNSLCKLNNLQTLKLLGCTSLLELPKDFGDLGNLEHLELEEMFWQKSPTLPSNIGSLKNLQNLHVFRLGHKPGYGINQLKNMLRLKGSLHISHLEKAKKTGEAYLKDKKGLVKLILEWSISNGGDEVKHSELIEDLQPHPNMEEIKILGYQGNRLPSWMTNSSTLEKLTSLSLKHCNNCKIISLGQLPHLQKLCLKGLVKLEVWSDEPYLNLHRLKIINCPKLKQVPSFFPSLRVLKITKCDSIETLPITPSLQFLILLNDPVLKNLSERFVFLEPPNDKGKHIITDSSFRCVLEMKIVNCPMVHKLPKIFFPQKLDISGCPLITALPTSEFSGRFQHLSIDTCDDGRLVKEIPATSSLYSLVISNIRNLNYIPILSNLPGLKALYIHGCNELVSLSDDENPFQGLNSLSLLSIRGCTNLDTLTENTLPSSLACLIIGSCSSLKSIGPKDVLKNLSSLRDLYIEHCPLLQSLPEGGVPTSLEHLRIEGCPILMRPCQDSMASCPKIMDINDLEIVESLEEACYPHFNCYDKGQTSGGN